MLPKTPNTKASGISYMGILSVAFRPDTIMRHIFMINKLCRHLRWWLNLLLDHRYVQRKLKQLLDYILILKFRYLQAQKKFLVHLSLLRLILFCIQKSAGGIKCMHTVNNVHSWPLVFSFITDFSLELRMGFSMSLKNWTLEFNCTF